MDLNKCREQIDKIDDQLLELFLKRMSITKEVAAYKLTHSLPTLNQAREEEILNKRAAQTSLENLKPYTREFFTDIMKLSKDYQEELRANTDPVLVILAAGMGSRYGGLKQMDPLGPDGEIIIDFSLYDAYKAGFKTVVCIIKEEIEEDFKTLMDRGPAKKLNILYAYQEKDALPQGYEVPADRVKPWGTAHAVLAANGLVNSPFAMINSDDYYGPDAFKTMYDYLKTAKDGEYLDFSMVAYLVENTLSDNGEVTRGVCKAEGGYLADIVETHSLKRDADGVIKGEFGSVADGTLVSMNMFGFTPALMDQLNERFPKTLDEILKTNPLKGEYLIPTVVDELIKEGKAKVRVLSSSDKWFGVTYKEDKPVVMAALKEKKALGVYPKNLWEN